MMGNSGNRRMLRVCSRLREEHVNGLFTEKELKIAIAKEVGIDSRTFLSYKRNLKFHKMIKGIYGTGRYELLDNDIAEDF